MNNNFFLLKKNLFFGIIFFFSCCLSFGEESASSDLKLYHFQSETVWARVTALVQDFHNEFSVEGESDSPISSWSLKDPQNVVLARGTATNAKSFKTKVNRPFQDTFQLTILVRGEEGEVPVLLKLSPENSQIWLTPTPPPYEPFVEHADHPYDTIVKNLYNQAAQAYVNDEKEKAYDLLTKAKKINPKQPQVLALMEKLKDGMEQIESKTILQQATEDWKSGDTETALSELDDFLNRYPDDEPVLQLKRKITQAQPKTTVVKKARVKTRSLPTVTPSIKKSPLTAQENQSQADEAYNLGLESYRKEDYMSAKKFWEQTLQLQPNHPQARRNLDRLTEEHPELK